MKKCDAMVKNLNPQCEGEKFKSLHLQISYTWLLNYLIG
jgi:hypothetical protein